MSSITIVVFNPFLLFLVSFEFQCTVVVVAFTFIRREHSSSLVTSNSKVFSGNSCEKEKEIKLEGGKSIISVSAFLPLHFLLEFLEFQFPVPVPL